MECEGTSGEKGDSLYVPPIIIISVCSFCIMCDKLTVFCKKGMVLNVWHCAKYHVVAHGYHLPEKDSTHQIFPGYLPLEGLFSLLKKFNHVVSNNIWKLLCKLRVILTKLFRILPLQKALYQSKVTDSNGNNDQVLYYTISKQSPITDYNKSWLILSKRLRALFRFKMGYYHIGDIMYIFDNLEMQFIFSTFIVIIVHYLHKGAEGNHNTPGTVSLGKRSFRKPSIWSIIMYSLIGIFEWVWVDWHHHMDMLLSP